MKIYTSYFAKSAGHPKAVAISNTSIPGYRGRSFTLLAPLWEWVQKYKDGNMTAVEFEVLYREVVLGRLDPQCVLSTLGDGAVMLCWESPEKFCHRHIVADWLVTRIKGLEVEEIT